MSALLFNISYESKVILYFASDSALLILCTSPHVEKHRQLKMCFLYPCHIAFIPLCLRQLRFSISLKIDIFFHLKLISCSTSLACLSNVIYRLHCNFHDYHYEKQHLRCAILHTFLSRAGGFSGSSFINVFYSVNDTALRRWTSNLQRKPNKWTFRTGATTSFARSHNVCMSNGRRRFWVFQLDLTPVILQNVTQYRCIDIQCQLGQLLLLPIVSFSLWGYLEMVQSGIRRRYLRSFTAIAGTYN